VPDRRPRVEDSRPRYSPDGASIVYGTQKDPDFYADRVRLVRFDRKTGTHTVLNRGVGPLGGGLGFDGAGRLVFPGRGPGTHVAVHASLAGGTRRSCARQRVLACLTAAEGPPLLHAPDADRAGRAVGPRRRTARRPRRSRASPSRSSRTSRSAKSRRWSFEGARGDTVQAYVILPAGLRPREEVPARPRHPRRAARDLGRSIPTRAGTASCSPRPTASDATARILAPRRRP